MWQSPRHRAGFALLSPVIAARPLPLASAWTPP